MIAFFRKAIRLLLASYFWLHALFIFHIHPSIVSKISDKLPLSGAEFVLVGLLILFSFLVGSGFGSALANLTYIYFFPFVLFFYVIWWTCKLLYAFGKSLTATKVKTSTEQIAVLEANPTVSLQVASKANAEEPLSKRIMKVVLRPFRARFIVFWCLFILFAAHIEIVWLALIVVLLHLVRAAYSLCMTAFASGGWFEQLKTAIHKNIENCLSKLSAVTADTLITPDLKGQWSVIRLYEMGVRLLENEAIISKWAILFNIVILGTIYLYLAFLFSFCYYGMIRIAGIDYAWSQLLAIALFIPFFASALPKLTPLWILAGLQCVLFAYVGARLVVSYFTRQLKYAHAVADAIAVKLEEPEVQERLLVLRLKFEEQKEKPVSSKS